MMDEAAHTPESKPPCSAMVTPPEEARAMRSYPCKRAGTVEREDRRYCTQHDPERIQQRRGEQHARWKAEDTVRDEALRRRRAEEAACEGIAVEALEAMGAGGIQELITACKRVETIATEIGTRAFKVMQRRDGVFAAHIVKDDSSRYLRAVKPALAKATGVQP